MKVDDLVDGHTHIVVLVLAMFERGHNEVDLLAAPLQLAREDEGLLVAIDKSVPRYARGKDVFILGERGLLREPDLVREVGDAHE